MFIIRKFIFFILILIISTSVFAQDLSEHDSFLFAQQAYQNGTYGVALDLFKRFIKQHSPNSKLIFEAQLYIAQCLFQRNEFIQAREILTQLEKANVSSAIEDRLLFWLGQVYLKVKDFPKAIEYLKKLTNGYPESGLSAHAKLQLGKVFFQNGDYKEAVDIFSSLSAYKDSAIKEESIFEKGQALYQLKDYNAVLKNYSTFSDIFLDSDKLAKAYFYMGEASFYLNDFVHAIEYYSDALERSQEDLTKIMCFLGIGWSYLKMNKPEEAGKAFLKIDDFKNQDFNKESFFLAKAVLFLRLKDYAEALNYYDKLITSYPESDIIIYAFSGKAECLINLGWFDEARKTYLKVMDTAKRMSKDQVKDVLTKTHYDLGSIYLTTQEFDAAISEFKDAISQSDDKEIQLSALLQIADAYQMKHEFKKAIETYSQIIKDFPNNLYNDYINYQLGIVFIKSGDFNSAISTFVAFNKNFSQTGFLDDVNYYLGYSYFKNNDYESAIRQLQNFLSAFLDSEYRDKAAYLLASSFYNMGKYQEAIEKFKDIIIKFKQDEDLVQKAEYGIADSLYQMGDKQQAIEKFKEFIDRHPKSEMTPNVIFWLGKYYYLNSQFELSRKNFQNLVRMYPEHNLTQRSWYEVGLTFLAEDKYTEAMQTFKRFLEVCKSREEKAKTMLTIGDLLLEQGREAQAKEVYNKLTQLISSNNIEAYNSKQKKEDGKTDLIGKTIEYTDDTLDTLGTVILREESDYARDNSDSTVKFVKLAFMKLGDLNKKNNNFQDALYAYRKALEYPRGENDAQIQFKIAECLEEEHNPDAALREYANMSYIYQEDKSWTIKGLLRSANIYEDKGDWQRAVEMYNKIISYDTSEAKYAKERIDLIK